MHRLDQDVAFGKRPSPAPHYPAGGILLACDLQECLLTVVCSAETAQAENELTTTLKINSSFKVIYLAK